MKTKVILILLLTFCESYVLTAKEIDIEFKVFGNCSMCEKRIEKAVLRLNGVLKANWNTKTNMMNVHYQDSLIKVREIHLAIAEAGHDTDLIFTHEDIYKNLPICCRYDRPKEVVFGMNRIVSVPPKCNPKKMSTNSNSCCYKANKN